jgi:2-methylcitrate dehydratase PrpD
VAGRMDEALTPGRMQRGFHGSVSTVFAGAVTVGRLLRLDAAGMTHAIALAASSAAGMAIAADTSCAREYHAGLAALLGTQAALAANAGFEAEVSVLDAPRGFFSAFNGQDVESVSRDLGGSWDIVTDMAIKLMPGAHPFHAIAEAAVDAADAAGVPPSQVRRVLIAAPQLGTWQHQAVQPHDLVSAAHSVPYFVATAVIHRSLGWDLLTPARMADPAVRELLPRVVFDPDAPALPDRFPHRHGGTVTLELEDGRRVSRSCAAPRGSGARGIDWADVDAKYRRLAPAAGLSADAVEQSLAGVHRLGAGSELSRLIALLGSPAPVGETARDRL